jgi:hypothetical protein
VLHLDAANPKSYPGSGTAWRDLSGVGNNGTLTNGPTYSSSNNGAIVFDGSNDYMTASPLPSGTNLFTISVWMYLSANINGDYGGSVKGAIIFSGNAVGTYELTLTTSGATAGPPYAMTLGRYGGDATGTCTVSGINMPIQQWHNVVVLRDGASSQKMYLNGVLLASGNISTSMTAGTLHIGGAPANASFVGYMNGNFSNITQYNRALTALEISQNFEATRGRYGI